MELDVPESRFENSDEIVASTPDTSYEKSPGKNTPQPPIVALSLDINRRSFPDCASLIGHTTNSQDNRRSSEETLELLKTVNNANIDGRGLSAGTSRCSLMTNSRHFESLKRSKGISKIQEKSLVVITELPRDSHSQLTSSVTSASWLANRSNQRSHVSAPVDSSKLVARSHRRKSDSTPNFKNRQKRKQKRCRKAQELVAIPGDILCDDTIPATKPGRVKPRSALPCQVRQLSKRRHEQFIKQIQPLANGKLSNYIST